MNVELAIGRDAHQPIEAAESRGVIGLADADAGDLRSPTLAAARPALFPVEASGPLFQRIREIGARDGPAVRADLGPDGLG